MHLFLLVCMFSLWFMGLDQDHCNHCLSSLSQLRTSQKQHFVCHKRPLKREQLFTFIRTCQQFIFLPKYLSYYIMTFILHIINTFNCIFDTIWLVLCWCTVKPPKQQTNKLSDSVQLSVSWNLACTRYCVHIRIHFLWVKNFQRSSALATFKSWLWPWPFDFSDDLARSMVFQKHLLLLIFFRQRKLSAGKLLQAISVML